MPDRKRADPGSAAFGWDRKLRKTDEFSSVFRFKCLQRGLYLDLYSRPNGLTFPRLGMVVPKRVLARAVDRNRVKRTLREVLRLQQTEVGGLDIVIRLKAASSKGSGEYRTECEELLRRSKRCTQNKVV